MPVLAHANLGLPCTARTLRCLPAAPHPKGAEPPVRSPPWTLRWGVDLRVGNPAEGQGRVPLLPHRVAKPEHLVPVGALVVPMLPLRLWLAQIGTTTTVAGGIGRSGDMVPVTCHTFEHPFLGDELDSTAHKPPPPPRDTPCSHWGLPRVSRACARCSCTLDRLLHA